MGMDAKVTIWVGVGQDFDVEELQERLPLMFDPDDDVIDPDCAMKEYGVEIEAIECSDETCGVGVEIFSHDWDFGPKEFDLAEITLRAIEAKGDLQKLFNKHGVTQMIKVWVQTDYR